MILITKNSGFAVAPVLTPLNARGAQNVLNGEACRPAPMPGGPIRFSEISKPPLPFSQIAARRARGRRRRVLMTPIARSALKSVL